MSVAFVVDAAVLLPLTIIIVVVPTIANTIDRLTCVHFVCRCIVYGILCAFLIPLKFNNFYF